MRITYRARVWIVAPREGAPIGFTDHDCPLEVDGVICLPDAGLSARAIVQSTGLSVDNSEAEGALSSAAITEADIFAGRWDGAEVTLTELDWRDLGRRVILFRGHLGEITRSAGAFRAELRGLAEPLGASRGRVFHPRCPAVLGDADCGVDLGAEGRFADAVVIEAEGAELRLSGAEGFADGWFTHGAASVRSGAALGLNVAVRDDRAGDGGARLISLWAEPGAALVPGDAVRLTAGCDKTMRHCRLKFGNQLNFRGFPHLPAEDWLMAPQTEPRARRASRPSGLLGGVLPGQK
ncbi:MAG: DUF2163 domain-containing protein [Paracoccus sp. (in: a-proteobacteria)]|nr:DUF2163 domain-containing protein [Paracoccus sp. (in: a-proteobacteria)]